MTAVSEDEVADLARKIAELREQLRSAHAERDAAVERQTAATLEQFRLDTELRAALDRQKASAEILRSIGATSGDAAYALRQIAETTAHFFNAPSVTIRIAEGDQWVQNIRVGSGSLASGAHPGSPLIAHGASLPATVYQENRQIHIPDLDNIDPSMAHWPAVATRAVGIRTISGTPLRREGKAIGALIIYRDRLAPFTDEELALQQSFADQAVIAIENARLFNETQETLARQTATSEILRVISGSPTDVRPVFDTIVRTAVRLLGCETAFIQRCDRTHFWSIVRCGREGLLLPLANSQRVPIDPSANFPSRVIVDKTTLHLPDWSQIELPEFERRIQEQLGYQSAVYLPLLREGECIGVLGIAGPRPGMFGETAIALAESFRDQAVIAVENTRLFNETQEALARQTATADILRVISGSPTDVQPVFDAIVRTAVRLLGCDLAFFMRTDGNTFSTVAGVNRDGPAALGPPHQPIDPTANFPSRAIATKQMLLLPDWAEIELPEFERRIQQQHGVKSSLYLPLLRGEACIGLLTLVGSRPDMFGASEIALAESFRDQALIAIENTRLFNETQEALERQTATAEVLQVINSSPGNLAPVFDAILEKAHNLCGVAQGSLQLYDGSKFRAVAVRGLSEAFANRLREGISLNPNAPGPHLLKGARFVQIPDLREIDDPMSRAAFELAGIRTVLFIPLRKDGTLLGRISASRAEVKLFTETEIGLLENFAAQAVIAIENARLFNETQEALERQTATADILKVIASSPSDVKPVFEAIAARAKSLVGGFSSTVFRFIDGMAHLEAFTPTTPEADDVLKSTFPRPVEDFAPFRMTQAGEVMQIPDTETLTDDILEISRARGFRSMVFAPLMNQGASIGFIAVTRVQPGGFSDHHVQVLQTFADQAVIAIENARLFDEVQAKTRDLEESLQQQTATADVLKVIGRSAFDLNQVFETVVESSVRLCAADRAIIFRFDGELLRVATVHNAAEDLLKGWLEENPIRPGRYSVAARAALERRTIQVQDVRADPNHTYGAKEVEPFRTVLGVPMLKGDDLLGVILVYHNEVKPFTDKQILLVSTFAEQAAIAIENVRLFDEVQAKTRDLEESLQQQTATSEVLQIISSSPSDLAPVFEKMLENATRVCGAGFGSMILLDGDMMRQAAFYNVPAELAAVRTNAVRPLHPLSSIATATRERRVIQTEDIRDSPAYLARAQHAIELAELGGARTIVVVPMLRDDQAIGVITVYRQEVRPFGEKQIDLLTNFARQAVIAIENARLLGELRQRTADLSKSLDDLRTAQDRLVQTEKLASLGQLTAGIAHEIKNPLNFVNNFSALSIELTDELNDLLNQATLAEKFRGEVDELTALLKDNLGKVVQHGKRADSIVKNMLLHSREGSGEHRPADVNALVDESLNLAYHGARAEKPQFNVNLQRDFDPEAGMIEVFPQEITRVLLNLIANGFYAVTKRKADGGGAGFEPLVTASTRGSSNHVEIRIRDNGTGIPPEVKEKMFNPFFTTKPAGEGTGLGLSMSHDIIVKQHGGTIDVDTEPGVFTEFTIVLPRTK